MTPAQKLIEQYVTGDDELIDVAYSTGARDWVDGRYGLDFEFSSYGDAFRFYGKVSSTMDQEYFYSEPYRRGSKWFVTVGTDVKAGLIK